MLNIYCVFLPLECNQNRNFFFTVLFTGVSQGPKQCLVHGGHSLTKYLYNEWIGKRLYKWPKVIPLSANVTWFLGSASLGQSQILLFVRAQDLLSKFSKAQRVNQPHLPSAMSILHMIITATVFIYFTFMVHTSIIHPIMHAEAYKGKVFKYSEN